MIAWTGLVESEDPVAVSVVAEDVRGGSVLSVVVSVGRPVEGAIRRRLGSVGDVQNAPSKDFARVGAGGLGVSLSPPECSRRFGGRCRSPMVIGRSRGETVVLLTLCRRVCV